MRRVHVLRWAAVLAVVALGGCTWIRSLVGAELPPGVSPGARHIAGDVARVGGVAISDLMMKRHEENILAEELERSDASGEKSTSRAAMLRACMARPETYDVYVAWTGDRYLVTVLPVIERCVRSGGHLFGGGAHYEISGTDYSILVKSYDE